jgi:nucleoside-diphosphate-sugar epimerase
MDRKSILITGGNGFIGSFLRNHYTGKYKIYAPGHSVLDLTNGDSVDKFFNQNHIDTVIHCALAGRDRINAIDHSLTVQNLEMFTNLWRNRNQFNRLINMGTGNEFDTSTNIHSAPEHEFFNHLPIASYGYAKNLIARIIHSTQNFYNLRLFGVFHHTESDKRFFKRLLHATDLAPFRIFQDHQFDFVNLEDLVPVIDSILEGPSINEFDINVVYMQKYLLSEYARMFADVHNIPHSRIIVEDTGVNNFTGNGFHLGSNNFNFKGLIAGFEQYRN